MTIQPASFNIKKAALIFFLVSLWFILWIFILLLQAPSSGIFPTFWVFSSGITLLLWLVYRFKLNFAETLKANWPHFVWILAGIILALVYWQLDHWILSTLIADKQSQNITNWQNSVQDYVFITVVFSTVILAPMFEELFFRGLLMNTLRQIVNDWFAVVFSALLFAIIHLSWPDFISLFLIGIIYGWLTLKSNSVIPAMLAHVIHNALTFWHYVSF